MDRTSHRRNEVGLPSLARVFLLLGLLSGTAPLSLTQELGRQPGELLRVASYNVENLFDNFDDPYRPDEGTSPKSLIELRILASSIDRLKADILALQEVENLGVLDRLNRSLREPYPYVEMLAGNDDRGIHCALLSRVEIRRALSHRFRDLEGRRRFSRNLPVFELRPGGDSSLLVAAVHFKSKRSLPGDPGGSKQRAAEAKAVLDVLHELRTVGYRAPFILLGDLNDTPDSESLAPLFAELEDATLRIPEESRYSYVFRGRKEQIDHVLFAGLRVAGARYVHEKDSASDHAPLLVEFRWPKPVARAPATRRKAFEPIHRPVVKATDTRRLRTFLLQEVEATGRVAHIEDTRRGGHKRILFADNDREGLVVFVPGRAVPRFPRLPSWKGKTVTIQGPVFRYRASLEIALRRPEQLKVHPKKD